MKKVTSLLLAMLLLVFMFKAEGQVTYSQGWENSTAGIAGWTNAGASMSRFTGTTVCTGTGAVRSNLYTAGHTNTFTSPLLGTSNGGQTTLTFQYKVANWSANTVGTPCASFSIEVLWATTTAGPWTSLGLINCSNHVVSGSCAQAPGTYQFTPNAGESVYVRFYTQRFAGDFYLNYDEVYVQEALPPCTGTPSPGNTIASVATSCPGSSFLLSLQNATPGSGVNYQWQSSPDGNDPWNNFGVSAPTASVSQTSATYYRCQVTCDTETGTSTPVYVPMNPNFMECYCAAGATSTSFEKISRVQFNTIDNPSTSTAGYENFFNVSTEITQSMTYPITVTIAGGYSSDQVLVWIDYNQNGFFTDPGELVYTSANGVGPHTANIVIPFASVTGATGMRVRMHDTSSGANATACGTSTYGQVEDYTVVIVAPPPIGILSGVVTDMYNDPIEGVVVTTSSAKDQTVTNADGEYELELYSGLYDVTFEMLGYLDKTISSFEIEPYVTNSLDVMLDYSPMPECAAIVYPANNAGGILPGASLSWAPTGANLPTGYKILLYNVTSDIWIEGDPITFEGTDLGNVTSYTPAEPLEWGSVYSWMIIPYNFSGGPQFCEPWGFQIAFGGSIAGTITDAGSGLPIEDITVSIKQVLPNNLNATVMTNASGQFNFAWETGSYNVTLSKFGYITKVFNNVAVNANQTTFINTTLVPYIPYAIPFYESWNSGTLVAQQWGITDIVPPPPPPPVVFTPNWSVVTYLGNPSPSAMFNWSPSRVNYSQTLQSHFINGAGADKVFVQFDLYLSNYETTTLEMLSFMINNGNGWETIATFDNQDDDIPWTQFSFDITPYAAGQLFYIGFKASGANTFNINNWNVDNIYITTDLMEVKPDALFEALAMGGTSSQEIKVINKGILPLAWEASLVLPTPWAVMPTMNGIIPGSGTSVIDINFDATGLTAGVYEGEIIFTGADGVTEQVVPVTLEVYEGSFQKINIPYADNWGYVSSFVELDGKMALETAMADILDEMIIMLGNDGIFWPGQNINTLGEWDNYKGYKLKMGEEGLLVFVGESVTDKTVSFPAGTYLIPVLSEYPIAASVVFGGHNIEFAFGLDGSIYWPFGQIFTLEELVPGYGYLVKFNAPTTLNFNVPKGSTSPNSVIAFENTTPWNDVYKTGDVHIIGIEAEAAAAMQKGDIVGVFNLDGLCTGMAYYNGNAMAVPVFGNDLTSIAKDGMGESEPMIIRIFSNGEITEINPVYSTRMPNSNGLFAVNGLSMITDLKLGATGIGNGQAQSLHIYPNPSNGLFTVDGAGNSYKLVVMNSQGQVVYTSDNSNSNTIDLTNQPNGVYFIRLTDANNTIIRKVIIQ